MRGRKSDRLLIILILFAAAIFAKDDQIAETSRSIDNILSEIRAQQNVNSIYNIDADQVDKMHLEKLGDAILRYLYPDEQKREFMVDLISQDVTGTKEDLNKRIGYKFIKDKFKLPVNDLSHSPEKEDYHVGYGEILILLALIMIVILIRIYSYVKRLALSHNGSDPAKPKHKEN